MTRIRRSPYAFLYLEDNPEAASSEDNPEAASSPRPTRLVAFAVLTGERHPLSAQESCLLQHISASEWCAYEPEAETVVRGLVEKGLVLSDSAEARAARLRRRDADLAATQWNGYAALFHFMTQWRGVGFAETAEQPIALSAHSRAVARAMVDVYGPPPAEFAEFGSGPAVSLPGVERDGDFYRTLRARRTTRAFDRATPMTVAQLDTVMRYVFGCHGYGLNSADVVCIKRTSPSGGGLAPVEAYAIVDGVDGVAPGIYHYNGRDHSLVRKAELTSGEGRALATEFMCGQSYFAAAHVTFVLTARFYRNHWKYRRHQKAYPGILMDAAHLTQTLYLVAAELGLGAFVTIAINGGDIEERLGLDGVREGVIAMAGCGPALPEGSPLDMRFDA